MGAHHQIARAVLLGTLLSVSAAAACPLCDTGTGQQVRAGIFGEDFTSNLLATLAPFPFFALFAGVLHVGLPRPWKSARPNPKEPS